MTQPTWHTHTHEGKLNCSLSFSHSLDIAFILPIGGSVESAEKKRKKKKWENRSRCGPLIDRTLPR